jgi:hypothetical protein
MLIQVDVEEQIRVIREATRKAARSKESALKFLIDAGIVKVPAPTKTKAKK